MSDHDDVFLLNTIKKFIIQHACIYCIELLQILNSPKGYNFKQLINS